MLSHRRTLMSDLMSLARRELYDRIAEAESQLQAIADAPRCEHGVIDEHWTEFDPLKNRMLDGKRCAGATELRDLLDALTQEDT
jgi:hypothetical protein